MRDTEFCVHIHIFTGNGDIVKCVLTSDATCATGSPATSHQITMTVSSRPPTPTTGSNSGINNPQCTGGTINLSASTIAGVIYIWTGPNNFTSFQQNPSITNVTTEASGYYYVIAIVNGCSSPADSTDVIVSSNIKPAFADTISNQSVCQGQSVTFTAIANATASLSYQWTKEGKAITGSTNSQF